jgi:alkanesulfonate monooxygenase
LLAKDERYARADEFLTIVRRLREEEIVDFQGEHLALRGAHLERAPDPTPTIYFGGSSAAAGSSPPSMQSAGRRTLCTFHLA